MALDDDYKQPFIDDDTMAMSLALGLVAGVKKAFVDL